MIARILCLVLLALFSHTENVAGDILVLNFNKSLTTSVCSSSNIVLAEKVIFTASLNASQTNLMEWPFDIFLYYYKNFCKISIKQYSCPGYTSECGYCHYKKNEMYYLVFNITANVTDPGSYYQYKLVDAKSKTQYSSSAFVEVASYPFSSTRYFTSTKFSVKNISLDTFIPTKNDASFQIRINNHKGYRQMRYSTATQYTNSRDSFVIYNLTSWDANVDNAINIKFQNSCNKSWTITVPVTDRPKPDCDRPTLSRSNSSGTIVSIKCKMSKTSYILLQSVTCSAYIYSHVSLLGTVVIDGDLVTCTVNFSKYSYPFGSIISADFQTNWNFLLDTQFTNGTKQLPRIVRFNINGIRSVTVEPGTDISFECKVYANPSARSVLAGTGIGRIQENWSSTDLLRYTLTGIKCQDTGRYWCKGVSEFGTTPFENQAYVDVNVRCPPAIRSHAPSNQDRKFFFVNDVLITLEVYGYPAPTEFGLQEQQGSSFVNVSEDKYTTKYVPLNPSLGLVSLLMQGSKTEESHVYVLTAYNNANKGVDFQFEVVRVSTDSQTSWLPAFIAVMFTLGVAIIIIIFLVIKLVHKKDGSKSFTDLRSGTPQSKGEGGGNTQRTHVTFLKADTPKQEPSRQESRYSHPTPDSNYTNDYQNPNKPEEVYVNVNLDDTYEEV